MAFRANEPVPRINFPGTANTIVEGHVGVSQDGSWWRERRQRDALASGDVSQFSASVDFGKPASRVRHVARQRRQARSAYLRRWNGRPSGFAACTARMSNSRRNAANGRPSTPTV